MYNFVVPTNDNLVNQKNNSITINGQNESGFNYNHEIAK